jgi:hypothetical protein
VDDFEKSLDFLQVADRQTVLRHIKAIRESNSALRIGQLLEELHRILAPYGLFAKAIAATGLVQRTAYAYRYGFQNVVESFPSGAVQAMMDRKLVINPNRGTRFGEWTEALEQVPPPSSGSATDYARWVDELIANKPKRLTGHLANRVRKSPDELILECDRVVERAWKRLPPQRVVRERFARRLIHNVKKRFELASEKISSEE